MILKWKDRQLKRDMRIKSMKQCKKGKYVEKRTLNITCQENAEVQLVYKKCRLYGTLISTLHQTQIINFLPGMSSTNYIHL